MKCLKGNIAKRLFRIAISKSRYHHRPIYHQHVPVYCGYLTTIEQLVLLHNRAKIDVGSDYPKDYEKTFKERLFKDASLGKVRSNWFYFTLIDQNSKYAQRLNKQIVL
jgi:hypothetical protein